MVLMPFLNTSWSVLYYEVGTILLAAVALLQLRLVHKDRVWVEVLLFSADFALLTFLLLMPNPFSPIDKPLVAQFRLVEFGYYFLYLALGTLAYSWRAIRIIALIGALIWLIGILGIWYFSEPHPSGPLVMEALKDYPTLSFYLDPESIRLDTRIREIAIFAMVAFVLSVTVKRFGDLMQAHVSVERERVNLARYFSPNMIDELSANDEPLRDIRVQDVAVLFVDIVGFTSFANNRPPEEVVETLRDFHALMERAVFNNGGTLDKFLGDGVMATFGTPRSCTEDALNALCCAKSMVAAVDAWNAERAHQKLKPIKISVGVHHGPCVLGDIGGENRLEFAVIGDTVNIASRVEAKTRELTVQILLTDAFVKCLNNCGGKTEHELDDFIRFEEQDIRGAAMKMTLFGR